MAPIQRWPGSHSASKSRRPQSSIPSTFTPEGREFMSGVSSTPLKESTPGSCEKGIRVAGVESRILSHNLGVRAF